jgi:hypothetical protein
LNVPHRIVGELPNTDAVMNRTFFVGVYPGIDASRREYMGEVLVGLTRLADERAGVLHDVAAPTVPVPSSAK